MDETGNWKGFREDGSGDGTWDLIQTRDSNAVNEITEIIASTGLTWAVPTYNRAGNMTVIPKPETPTSSYNATYDAWNRMVTLEAASGIVSVYAYDSAKRRIIQKIFTGGILSETRHLYYTQPTQWQVIEERLGISPDSASPDRQFVWGRRYVDECILRDSSDARFSPSRIYSMIDANWNGTGLLDENGTVIERIAYMPYGAPIFFSADFTQQADGCNWETLCGGYRYDSATGLYSVRHRIFHPIMGTWLQRDPFARKTVVNLYEFVLGSPVNLTDPFGLDPIIAGCLGGLAGGLLINGFYWLMGTTSGCEALLSTFCSTGMGCLLGLLVDSVAADVTGTIGEILSEFIKCAGPGAIIGAMTTACNAAAHGVCGLFGCDKSTLNWGCLVADIIGGMVGAGLGCGLPVGGKEELLAFLIGFDVSSVVSMAC